MLSAVPVSTIEAKDSSTPIHVEDRHSERNQSTVFCIIKARTSVTLSGFVLVGIANLLLRTTPTRDILSDGDCVQRTDFQFRAGRADVSDRFWNRSFLRYASPTMPIERGLKNICGAPYSLT